MDSSTSTANQKKMYQGLAHRPIWWGICSVEIAIFFSSKDEEDKRNQYQFLAGGSKLLRICREFLQEHRSVVGELGKSGLNGKEDELCPINTASGRDLTTFCAVLWDFLTFTGMERVGTEQEKMLGKRTTKVKQVELSGGFKNK